MTNALVDARTLADATPALLEAARRGAPDGA